MLSRRAFLKSAAVSTAIPAIAPNLARAAASDRLTIGMIGVGTMGAHNHLRNLLKRDDVEVVAVCDVVAERMANAVAKIEEAYAARKKSGASMGIKQYGDFRQLLEQPGIDAVLIATPDHWHTIPCILSARAGKHIYCEKPLTHNIAEGRRIVDEVRKAKVIFQTGSQQRSEFRGHFRKAVDYVWNGRIGQVKTVRIGVAGPPKPCDLPAQEIPAGTNWEMWTGPAPLRDYNDALCPRGVHTHFPAWRAYEEYAGGGLADMGAHHFDIAQWALGMDTSGPVLVTPPEDRAQEHGLRFTYANGVVMIHNEFEGDVKADCVFEGSEGVILVSRSGISSRPASILETPLDSTARHVIPSTNHHENWINAIRSKKETICPAEVGHRSASICHLANIGYRVRRTLKWDPQRETFIDDTEANALTSRQPRGEWSKV